MSRTIYRHVACDARFAARSSSKQCLRPEKINRAAFGSVLQWRALTFAPLGSPTFASASTCGRPWRPDVPLRSWIEGCDMFVKAELANICSVDLASFDVIYICPHRSELGTLIFRRRHTPPRRALFIELPRCPSPGLVQFIRDELDPRHLEDEWLP
jgi:hypothetical protein